jgi:hypothetical protein
MSELSTDEQLDLIKKHESAGRNVPNYRFDPGHTAQGYYQITNTNWNNIAPQVGVDVSKYPNAMAAPEDTQRKVAEHLLTKTPAGIKNWTDFNPQLSAAIGGKMPDKMMYYPMPDGSYTPMPAGTSKEIVDKYINDTYGRGAAAAKYPTTGPPLPKELQGKADPQEGYGSYLMGQATGRNPLFPPESMFGGGARQMAKGAGEMGQDPRQGIIDISKGAGQMATPPLIGAAAGAAGAAGLAGGAAGLGKSLLGMGAGAVGFEGAKKLAGGAADLAGTDPKTKEMVEEVTGDVLGIGASIPGVKGAIGEKLGAAAKSSYHWTMGDSPAARVARSLAIPVVVHSTGAPGLAKVAADSILEVVSGVPKASRKQAFDWLMSRTSKGPEGKPVVYATPEEVKNLTRMENVKGLGPTPPTTAPQTPGGILFGGRAGMQPAPPPPSGITPGKPMPGMPAVPPQLPRTGIEGLQTQPSVGQRPIPQPPGGFLSQERVGIQPSPPPPPPPSGITPGKPMPGMPGTPPSTGVQGLEAQPPIKQGPTPQGTGIPQPPVPQPPTTGVQGLQRPQVPPQPGPTPQGLGMPQPPPPPPPPPRPMPGQPAPPSGLTGTSVPQTNVPSAPPGPVGPPKPPIQAGPVQPPPSMTPLGQMPRPPAPTPQQAIGAIKAAQELEGVGPKPTITPTPKPSPTPSPVRGEKPLTMIDKLAQYLAINGGDLDPAKAKVRDWRVAMGNAMRGGKGGPIPSEKSMTEALAMAKEIRTASAASLRKKGARMMGGESIKPAASISDPTGTTFIDPSGKTSIKKKGE